MEGLRCVFHQPVSDSTALEAGLNVQLYDLRLPELQEAFEDAVLLCHKQGIQDLLFPEVAVDQGYDLQFSERELLLLENGEVVDAVVENKNLRDAG